MRKISSCPITPERVARGTARGTGAERTRGRSAPDGLSILWTIVWTLSSYERSMRRFAGEEISPLCGEARSIAGTL
jgi:hypothetical protein